MKVPLATFELLNNCHLLKLFRISLVSKLKLIISVKLSIWRRYDVIILKIRNPEGFLRDFGLFRLRNTWHMEQYLRMFS